MKKWSLFLILSLFLSNCCSFSYMFHVNKKLDIIKKIPNAKKEVIFNATIKQLKTDYDIVGTTITYENIEEGQIITRSSSFPEKDPTVGGYHYTMKIDIKDDTISIMYGNIISEFMGKKRQICLDSKWEVIIDHMISLREKLITLIINDIITDI